jgi:hypothetical protein
MRLSLATASRMWPCSDNAAKVAQLAAVNQSTFLNPPLNDWSPPPFCWAFWRANSYWARLDALMVASMLPTSPLAQPKSEHSRSTSSWQNPITTGCIWDSFVILALLMACKVTWIVTFPHVLKAFQSRQFHITAWFWQSCRPPEEPYQQWTHSCHYNLGKDQRTSHAWEYYLLTDLAGVPCGYSRHKTGSYRYKKTKHLFYVLPRCLWLKTLDPHG